MQHHGQEAHAGHESIVSRLVCKLHAPAAAAAAAAAAAGAGSQTSVTRESWIVLAT